MSDDLLHCHDMIVLEVEGFSRVESYLNENHLSVSFRAWDFNSDHESDDWDIKGFLKWDGCLHFMTNPDCYYHLVDSSQLDRIRTLFNAIGDDAVRRVRNYEGDFRTS